MRSLMRLPMPVGVSSFQSTGAPAWWARMATAAELTVIIGEDHEGEGAVNQWVEP
jgi:hypothetical protein